MEVEPMVTQSQLRRYLHLPASEVARKAMADLERPELRGLKNRYNLESRREQLRECEERDAILATRPAGCRCLGYGRDGDGAFCGCPDGVAAEAEHESLASRQRTEVIANLIGRAGIPPRFADISAATFPAHGSRAASDVAAWRPTFERCGLFLFGPYGRGKTGLAVSALRSHIERTATFGAFVVVLDLLDAIRENYDRKPGTESTTDLLTRVKTAPFLVLDDIGAERTSGWVRERMHAIINHRHGACLATIITSNLSLEELAREHMDERTCWRIREMCEAVQIDGANLRERAT